MRTQRNSMTRTIGLKRTGRVLGLMKCSAERIAKNDDEVARINKEAEDSETSTSGRTESVEQMEQKHKSSNPYRKRNLFEAEEEKEKRAEEERAAKERELVELARKMQLEEADINKLTKIAGLVSLCLQELEVKDDGQGDDQMKQLISLLIAKEDQLYSEEDDGETTCSLLGRTLVQAEVRQKVPYVPLRLSELTKQLKIRIDETGSSVKMGGTYGLPGLIWDAESLVFREAVLGKTLIFSEQGDKTAGPVTRQDVKKYYTSKRNEIIGKSGEINKDIETRTDEELFDSFMLSSFGDIKVKVGDKDITLNSRDRKPRNAGKPVCHEKKKMFEVINDIVVMAAENLGRAAAAFAIDYDMGRHERPVNCLFVDLSFAGINSGAMRNVKTLRLNAVLDDEEAMVMMCADIKYDPSFAKTSFMKCEVKLEISAQLLKLVSAVKLRLTESGTVESSLDDINAVGDAVWDTLASSELLTAMDDAEDYRAANYAILLPVLAAGGVRPDEGVRGALTDIWSHMIDAMIRRTGIFAFELGDYAAERNMIRALRFTTRCSDALPTLRDKVDFLTSCILWASSSDEINRREGYDAEIVTTPEQARETSSKSKVRVNKMGHAYQAIMVEKAMSDELEPLQLGYHYLPVMALYNCLRRGLYEYKNLRMGAYVASMLALNRERLECDHKLIDILKALSIAVSDSEVKNLSLAREVSWKASMARAKVVGVLTNRLGSINLHMSEEEATKAVAIVLGTWREKKGIAYDADENARQLALIHTKLAEEMRKSAFQDELSQKLVDAQIVRMLEEVQVDAMNKQAGSTLASGGVETAYEIIRVREQVMSKFDGKKEEQAQEQTRSQQLQLTSEMAQQEINDPKTRAAIMLGMIKTHEHEERLRAGVPHMIGLKERMRKMTGLSVRSEMEIGDARVSIGALDLADKDGFVQAVTVNVGQAQVLGASLVASSDIDARGNEISETSWTLKVLGGFELVLSGFARIDADAVVRNLELLMNESPKLCDQVSGMMRQRTRLASEWRRARALMGDRTEANKLRLEQMTEEDIVSGAMSGAIGRTSSADGNIRTELSVLETLTELMRSFHNSDVFSNGFEECALIWTWPLYGTIILETSAFAASKAFDLFWRMCVQCYNSSKGIRNLVRDTNKLANLGSRMIFTPVANIAGATSVVIAVGSVGARTTTTMLVKTLGSWCNNLRIATLDAVDPIIYRAIDMGWKEVDTSNRSFLSVPAKVIFSRERELTELRESRGKRKEDDDDTGNGRSLESGSGIGSYVAEFALNQTARATLTSAAVLRMGKLAIIRPALRSGAILWRLLKSAIGFTKKIIIAGSARAAEFSHKTASSIRKASNIILGKVRGVTSVSSEREGSDVISRAKVDKSVKIVSGSGINKCAAKRATLKDKAYSMATEALISWLKRMDESSKTAEKNKLAMIPQGGALWSPSKRKRIDLLKLVESLPSEIASAIERSETSGSSRRQNDVIGISLAEGVEIEISEKAAYKTDALAFNDIGLKLTESLTENWVLRLEPVDYAESERRKRSAMIRFVEGWEAPVLLGNESTEIQLIDSDGHIRYGKIACVRNLKTGRRYKFTVEHLLNYADENNLQENLDRVICLEVMFSNDGNENDVRAMLPINVEDEDEIVKAEAMTRARKFGQGVVMAEHFFKGASNDIFWAVCDVGDYGGRSGSIVIDRRGCVAGVLMSQVDTTLTSKYTALGRRILIVGAFSDVCKPIVYASDSEELVKESENERADRYADIDFNLTASGRMAEGEGVGRRSASQASAMDDQERARKSNSSFKDFIRGAFGSRRQTRGFENRSSTSKTKGEKIASNESTMKRQKKKNENDDVRLFFSKSRAEFQVVGILMDSIATQEELRYRHISSSVMNLLLDAWKECRSIMFLCACSVIETAVGALLASMEINFRMLRSAVEVNEMAEVVRKRNRFHIGIISLEDVMAEYVLYSQSPILDISDAVDVVLITSEREGGEDEVSAMLRCAATFAAKIKVLVIESEKIEKTTSLDLKMECDSLKPMKTGEAIVLRSSKVDLASLVDAHDFSSLRHRITIFSLLKQKKDLEMLGEAVDAAIERRSRDIVVVHISGLSGEELIKHLMMSDTIVLSGWLAEQRSINFSAKMTRSRPADSMSLDLFKDAIKIYCIKMGYGKDKWLRNLDCHKVDFENKGDDEQSCPELVVTDDAGGRGLHATYDQLGGLMEDYKINGIRIFRNDKDELFKLIKAKITKTTGSVILIDRNDILTEETNNLIIKQKNKVGYYSVIYRKAKRKATFIIVYAVMMVKRAVIRRLVSIVAAAGRIQTAIKLRWAILKFKTARAYNKFKSNSADRARKQGKTSKVSGEEAPEINEVFYDVGEADSETTMEQAEEMIILDRVGDEDYWGNCAISTIEIESSQMCRHCYYEIRAREEGDDSSDAGQETVEKTGLSGMVALTKEKLAERLNNIAETTVTAMAKYKKIVSEVLSESKRKVMAALRVVWDYAKKPFVYVAKKIKNAGDSIAGEIRRLKEKAMRIAKESREKEAVEKTASHSGWDSGEIETHSAMTSMMAAMLGATYIQGGADDEGMCETSVANGVVAGLTFLLAKKAVGCLSRKAEMLIEKITLAAAIAAYATEAYCIGTGRTITIAIGGAKLVMGSNKTKLITATVVSKCAAMVCWLRSEMTMGINLETVKSTLKDEDTRKGWKRHMRTTAKTSGLVMYRDEQVIGGRAYGLAIYQAALKCYYGVKKVAVWSEIRKVMQKIWQIISSKQENKGPIGVIKTSKCYSEPEKITALVAIALGLGGLVTLARSEAVREAAVIGALSERRNAADNINAFWKSSTTYATAMRLGNLVLAVMNLTAAEQGKRTTAIIMVVASIVEWACAAKDEVGLSYGLVDIVSKAIACSYSPWVMISAISSWWCDYGDKSLAVSALALTSGRTARFVDDRECVPIQARVIKSKGNLKNDRDIVARVNRTAIFFKDAETKARRKLMDKSKTAKEAMFDASVCLKLKNLKNRLLARMLIEDDDEVDEESKNDLVDVLSIADKTSLEADLIEESTGSRFDKVKHQIMRIDDMFVNQCRYVGRLDFLAFKERTKLIVSEKRAESVLFWSENLWEGVIDIMERRMWKAAGDSRADVILAMAERNDKPIAQELSVESIRAFCNGLVRTVLEQLMTSIDRMNIRVIDADWRVLIRSMNEKATSGILTRKREGKTIAAAYVPAKKENIAATRFLLLHGTVPEMTSYVNVFAKRRIEKVKQGRIVDRKYVITRTIQAHETDLKMAVMDIFGVMDKTLKLTRQKTGIAIGMNFFGEFATDDWLIRHDSRQEGVKSGRQVIRVSLDHSSFDANQRLWAIMAVKELRKELIKMTVVNAKRAKDVNKMLDKIYEDLAIKTFVSASGDMFAVMGQQMTGHATTSSDNSLRSYGYALATAKRLKDLTDHEIRIESIRVQGDDTKFDVMLKGKDTERTRKEVRNSISAIMLSMGQDTKDDKMIVTAAEEGCSFLSHEVSGAWLKLRSKHDDFGTARTIVWPKPSRNKQEVFAKIASSLRKSEGKKTKKEASLAAAKSSSFFLMYCLDGVLTLATTVMMRIADAVMSTFGDKISKSRIQLDKLPWLVRLANVTGEFQLNLQNALMLHGMDENKGEDKLDSWLLSMDVEEETVMKAILRLITNAETEIKQARLKDDKALQQAKNEIKHILNGGARKIEIGIIEDLLDHGGRKAKLIITDDAVGYVPMMELKEKVERAGMARDLRKGAYKTEQVILIKNTSLKAVKAMLPNLRVNGKGPQGINIKKERRLAISKEGIETHIEIIGQMMIGDKTTAIVSSEEAAVVLGDTAKTVENIILLNRKERSELYKELNIRKKEFEKRKEMNNLVSIWNLCSAEDNEKESIDEITKAKEKEIGRKRSVLISKTRSKLSSQFANKLMIY